jgi:hypothetical protein
MLSCSANSVSDDTDFRSSPFDNTIFFKGIVYVRNNKSKTTKNMRCFPQCLPAGHTDRHFCGCPVEARIIAPALSNKEELLVFGGIWCAIAEMPFVIGQKVKMEALTSYAESNGMTQGFWATGGGETRNVYAIFPGMSSGWNYLWNTNQGRGKVCHFFSVMCFKPSVETPGFLECVGVGNSTEFEVCSSKRSHGKPGVMGAASKRSRTSTAKEPIPAASRFRAGGSAGLHLSMLDQGGCETTSSIAALPTAGVSTLPFVPAHDPLSASSSKDYSAYLMPASAPLRPPQALPGDERLASHTAEDEVLGVLMKMEMMKTQQAQQAQQAQQVQQAQQAQQGQHVLQAVQAEHQRYQQAAEAQMVRGGVKQGGVTQGGVMQGGVLQGGVLQGGVLQGGVLQGGVMQGGVLQNIQAQQQQLLHQQLEMLQQQCGDWRQGQGQKHRLHERQRAPTKQERQGQVQEGSLTAIRIAAAKMARMEASVKTSSDTHTTLMLLAQQAQAQVWILHTLCCCRC